MKKAKLNDLFLLKGELAQIIGIAEQPTVIIEMIKNKKCPHCNGDFGKEQFSVIQTSPLFQENAQPIQTLE